MSNFRRMLMSKMEEGIVYTIDMKCKVDPETKSGRSGANMFYIPNLEKGKTYRLSYDFDVEFTRFVTGGTLYRHYNTTVAPMNFALSSTLKISSADAIKGKFSNTFVAQNDIVSDTQNFRIDTFSNSKVDLDFVMTIRNLKFELVP